jgi:hypothetical protein
VPDFVAYHNPDTMGYAADEVEGLNFLTNKNLPFVVGSRVWMVTGERRGRAREWRFLPHHNAVRRHRPELAHARLRAATNSGRPWRSA